MASRARLEGLGRALRAVQRVPEAMREARSETLHEWAETVQDGAEARVPRRTGELWAALDHRVDERYGRAEVGVWEEDQLEYSLYVEKGTSSMDDQPYLTPAFDEARPTVPAKYRAAFRRHMGGGE
ncbi:HK97 gp10 family phage protein [Streptomyces malaysiensis subsp. malaysiensis]|uniref:HK97-gp10 family putative phage morphogenesis protein n=1 Tax=Streptomyces malaysiensis TaxID=92644 RepID=UPI0024BF8475|nr:HK97-gp10 family putative phage morphogenesis protein [Streptomyces sp. NA07423]WHX19827.1 HK97 gp10 family phage protein [Streptomyces sp. NA07423]